MAGVRLTGMCVIWTAYRTRSEQRRRTTRGWGWGKRATTFRMRDGSSEEGAEEDSRMLYLGGEAGVAEEIRRGQKVDSAVTHRKIECLTG